MPHHLLRSAGELFLLLLGVWVIVFGVLEARAALRNGHIHSGRGGTTRLSRRINPRLYWSTTLFNGVVLPLLGAAILLVLTLVHFQAPAGDDESRESSACRGAACWRSPNP